jgi:cytochrome d ubiquinol oxidase subunit I
MGPTGFVAVICGWITTEVGRQPYTIYGVLRTSDSVSPIGLPGVAASLVGFIIVYALVFGAGMLFILREMAHAPLPDEPGLPQDVPHRAAGIMPGPAEGPHTGLIGPVVT